MSDQQEQEFLNWVAGFRNNKLAAREAYRLWKEAENKIEPPAARQNKIYIAGPMSNLPGFNYPAFNAKAQELRAKGHTVVNPADHGVIDGMVWEDYLRFDIGNLVRCESIYMLPGWSNSKGARLEYHTAVQLGMPIYFDPRAERTANFGV